MAVAVVGAAVGLGLIALAETRGAPSRPVIRPSTILAEEQVGAEACARCHPRQSAEWQRSVMAHAARSPLFQAREMLIEEQVGRGVGCEHGAGILRRADPSSACRDRQSGRVVTGSGGEHWCVNCHAPQENLRASMPPWDGVSGVSSTRRPLRDLLSDTSMQGIGCAFCHQAHGPVRPGDRDRGRYEGNPFWTSVRTGQRFSMRPEDEVGRFGIANSGYALDPSELIPNPTAPRDGLAGFTHARPSDAARRYLRSSEFCGACHDVRLFGSDGLRASRGEHFKRLRNGYSEWRRWAASERAQGRVPATCQDCHMSRFPGTCVPTDRTDGAPRGATSGSTSGSTRMTALEQACPPGTQFSAQPPGTRVSGAWAVASTEPLPLSTHYFSGVDIPLDPDLPQAWIRDSTLDIGGTPVGASERRQLLLGSTFRFELEAPVVHAGALGIPVLIENIGAGHRVPAGFSQEREIWVHLRVTDAAEQVLYEVGRVERGDEDLHDKLFLQVRTDDRVRDGLGRPLGLFGADVADGPDVPVWRPEEGGTAFRGRGLINLQNGFLRCVRCIGTIDARGVCQPGPGQGRTRADRFADGAFDVDTGICRSNLVGEHAFLEVYFPVGSLDARRGVVRGPDAIVDTRSAPPGVPLRYTYELAIPGARRPRHVEARLLFRAFPPFLIRAFASYERIRAAQGARPSGALVTDDMLERLEVVELARAEVEIE